MLAPFRQLMNFFGHRSLGRERIFIFLILPPLLLGVLVMIYGVLVQEGVSRAPVDGTAAAGSVARVQPLEPRELIRELESAEAQEKALRTGEVGPLLEQFERLTRSNPENDRSWGGYGRCLLKQERAAEALEALDHACRLNVIEARHFSARASARRALGDQRGALADYSDALRLRPGDVLVTNRLLFVAMEVGGVPLLEHKISEISKSGGPEPEATWVVGAAAREMCAGNFDSALSLMEKARQLLPDNHLGALLQDPIFADRRGQEFLARFRAARIVEAN